MNTQRERIIKALEVCTGRTSWLFGCKHCPYKKIGCKDTLMVDCLSFIKWGTKNTEGGG